MPRIRTTATLFVALATLASAMLAATPASADGKGPKPGTPAYFQRDQQNMQDAWGRELGPDGQFMNPNYGIANLQQMGPLEAAQLARQARAPTDPALGPGNWFPGWNAGNPFRDGWKGKRGRLIPVSYTNRYGALIRGTIFAPLPHARDPYTGAPLRPPYPGVVITEGSIQASQRMYWWIAEDLAERGYVTMTYDVQGQGTSESTPHEGGYPFGEVPYCDPSSKPPPGEQSGCPGVPSQQLANFVFGTEDAISFFLSTPSSPYKNPHATNATLDTFNPSWKLFDRSPDRSTVTPGRTTRIAIIGHSLGATAISYVQAVDPR